jgi:hypothetical protein
LRNFGNKEIIENTEECRVSSVVEQRFCNALRASQADPGDVGKAHFIGVSA